MSNIINENNILIFDEYIKEHPNILNYNISSNTIALRSYRIVQKGLYNVGEVDNHQKRNIESHENSNTRTAKDFGVSFSKTQTILKNKKIKFYANSKGTLTSALTSSAIFSGIYETTTNKIISEET